MTRFDPPPARPLLPGRRDAIRQQLQTIVTEHTRRRQGRKPALITIGAVVVLGTSAGAIVYVQQSQPVTNKSEARCYTVASLADGNQSYSTIAEALPVTAPPGSIGQVDHAVSVCAALWRQGFLRPGAAGVTRPRSTTANHRVPPLIFCVMPDGTAAVFPGNSRTCANLGLPKATKQ